ncbi:MAG: hypothetical protein KDD48_01670 [Bdellovibrionales bacterium]|nr:hypothetical protein [Bdellovibrionales bacterium]
MNLFAQNISDVAIDYCEDLLTGSKSRYKLLYEQLDYCCDYLDDPIGDYSSLLENACVSSFLKGYHLDDVTLSDFKNLQEVIMKSCSMFCGKKGLRTANLMITTAAKEGRKYRSE